VARGESSTGSTFPAQQSGSAVDVLDTLHDDQPVSPVAPLANPMIAGSSIFDGR
jgi:hypothetical protein